MDGQFLHPGLLAAGGLLAAAPIVLHLIMRQQPRRLEFPALRFIVARKDANRRKLRLRHLLLLALRVAALLLIGAALSRPRIKSTGGLADQESPIAAALVFDTAPRMAYLHENRTRLDAAREACQELLPRLPKDSRVAVVDGGRGEASFQVDVGSAQERIARLETSAVARPLWESVEAAARLLQKSDFERREIYVFTDQAAAAWEIEPATRLQESLAEVENLGVYAIDVGVPGARNAALGDLRFDFQVLAREYPWVLHVDVASQGGSSDRAVEVYLFDRLGKPEKKGQETVSLAENEARTLDFPMPGLPIGVYQGFVQLLGADGLAFDDRRFFTVEVKPPWKLLVVAPDPAADRAYDFVQTVADDESLRAGRSRFDCTTVSYEELGEQVLENYASVCLLDPPPLSDPVWESLREYVAAGGGLFASLGSGAQQTERFNRPAALELLPGELTKLARAPSGGLLPDTDRVEHSLLANFKPLRGEAIWTGLPIYRYWRFKQIAVGCAVVVPLTNRQPLLIERPVGKGRVLTFATSLAEPYETDDRQRWSRLQTGLERWPYHMLVNETMLYLVGSTDSRLNYPAGLSAVLKLDPAKKISTCLISTPGGDPQRLSADATQTSITVGNTANVGNYRVRAGGQEEGVDLGFSVNSPSSASRLERLADERLASVWGETPHAVVRGREAIARTVQAGRVGVELFPILMAALLVILGCEQVVSNRFYRERRG